MSKPWEQLTIAREFAVRRSELTCPGHSMKMMAKAAASSADEVIFDLEDACAVSQKEGARLLVAEALSTFSFDGKIRAFRPNAVSTRYFYKDVITVLETAGRWVDVVVVPKVESEEDVRFADRLISQIEEEVGLDQGRIQLEVLIESAQGLLNAERIAKASRRMASLIFGIADYAGDVGARFFGRASPHFSWPRAQMLAAARAAGILAVDHVTVQFKDLALVQAEAEDAAAMGYDGKWAIHPSQLEPIHAAFTPTREELEQALAIMKAYAQADTENGLGAIVFNDEMIDAASLRVHWKKLSVARKAGLLDAHFQFPQVE